MRKIFKAISILFDALCNSAYWMFRDLKYGVFTRNLDNLLNRLLVAGHVLEKGITMPNRRLGFGQDVVLTLMDFSNQCISKYGKDYAQLQYALEDLEEYLLIHEENNYELPERITDGIKALLKYKTEKLVPSKEFTPEVYFRECKDYKEFAAQRHSVRNFTNREIPEDLLNNALQLAISSAPSACNRQSIRVKVASREKKDMILQLQNGNRGFGHLVNKLLVVTGEQTAWNYDCRSSCFIDGGIFTMNLLLALHYYKICACTLNAHLSRSRQKELREIVGMKNSEIPIVFIAIGLPAQSFTIASSRRLPFNDIVSYV